MADISVEPVAGKRDFDAFVDFAYVINAGDPNWVPPLRAEVVELLKPGKNPFHEHARVQLFLARRGGKIVGRISAHYDELALVQPPEQGMTRVLAPISLSIWEEPGLLVKGHDHPPMVMMGHNSAAYEAWVESAGYAVAKRLLTYDLPVEDGFPPLINRIVASGEKNGRIRIRPVDKRHFDRDAAIILGILNDAWSQNWGFVPFTETEKAYGARKLAPLIIEGTNMIAEVEGEPVAFMLSLPDVNTLLTPMKGRLFPFNWIRLLLWLRNPQSEGFRVPLMGVVRKLQSSRLASQLAFMMIEYIRRCGVGDHGAKRAEVGWILEDNQGMVAIADAIGSTVNREYRIYAKEL